MILSESINVELPHCWENKTSLPHDNCIQKGRIEAHIFIRCVWNIAIQSTRKLLLLAKKTHKNIHTVSKSFSCQLAYWFRIFPCLAYVYTFVNADELMAKVEINNLQCTHNTRNNNIYGLVVGISTVFNTFGNFLFHGVQNNPTG